MALGDRRSGALAVAIALLLIAAAVWAYSNRDVNEVERCRDLLGRDVTSGEEEREIQDLRCEDLPLFPDSLP